MRNITTINANLFAISADELGDPLLWIAIAIENGLTDPFLSGMAELSIPASSAAFVDGIGVQ